MNNDYHEIYLEIEEKARDLVKRLNDLDKNVNRIYNEIHKENIDEYKRLNDSLFYFFN